MGFEPYGKPHEGFFIKPSVLTRCNGDLWRAGLLSHISSIPHTMLTARSITCAAGRLTARSLPSFLHRRRPNQMLLMKVLDICYWQWHTDPTRMLVLDWWQRVTPPTCQRAVWSHTEPACALWRSLVIAGQANMRAVGSFATWMKVKSLAVQKNKSTVYNKEAGFEKHWVISPPELWKWFHERLGYWWSPDCFVIGGDIPACQNVLNYVMGHCVLKMQCLMYATICKNCIDSFVMVILPLVEYGKHAMLRFFS